MDFTVITPNLNSGRFIRDCLGSVASQEGVTVEHLVMDGGSTDESESVVAAFPHATWISGRDSGMSQAINHGFDRATGDWVMWLNADDRLKPGALERMLYRSRASTGDILYGDFAFMDRNGDLLRPVRLPGWSRFVHVHHHCYVASTAAFYRRSTVLDAGYRLREDFHYVMDGEFYARLDEEGLQFEHVASPVADFRLHGGNASMRYLGKSKDIDRILCAERQHVESRAIRRAYGITLFEDPYLNGLIDGALWIVARGWKGILKLFS